MPTEKQYEIYKEVRGAAFQEHLEWEVLDMAMDSLFYHSPELVIEKLQEALNDWDI